MNDMTPAEGAQGEPNPQQQWLDYAKSLISHFQSHGSYTGPQVQLNVRPMFAMDEVRILQAPYRSYEFAGIGDGTVPDAMLGAAGAVASGNLAVMAGSIAGNLIAGSRAKKAAIPQWHDAGSGTLIVTQYGFYMLPADGDILPMKWHGFVSMQLTAWDSCEMDLDYQEGKAALVTPAATTIFGLWCLALYPQHPQLQTLLQS